MVRNLLCLPGNVSAFRAPFVAFFLISLIFHSSSAATHDYHDALRKSIIFFVGQHSGKLPLDQRLKWRHNSTLHDGFAVRVDLSGGY
ncbi:hypothetical protein ACFX2C_004109 [Malus domestica]